MGQVMAVCISEKKGTQKKGISEGHFIEEFGIENDAHAGKWHRLSIRRQRQMCIRDRHYACQRNFYPGAARRRDEGRG